MNAPTQSKNKRSNLEKVSLGFLIATSLIITAFLVVSVLNHFA